MRKTHIFTCIFLLALFSIPFWGNSFTLATGDMPAYSKNTRDTVLSIRIDSVRIPKDTLSSDSIPKKKNALDAIINYTSEDSLILTADNLGYLFGKSEVVYTELELKAENITMNMDSSIARASYGVDSTGAEFGYPVFSDHGVEYEAKGMSYNLNTKKMFASGIITEQGEGYITAGVAKKTEGDAFFMHGGRYTTCSDHDCPHFYLAMTKAKVRPKKNAVAGPVYLVIEDLPLPFIGLPFGFFPFSDKYSSGILMPSFGDEMDRGFFLRDGGYYFAINDNIDLALRGEVYTKGSWGLSARSSYRKRYAYSGGFDVRYLVTKNGDKDIPNDYLISKDAQISWTHTQDPKANMFRTLSASVNFATSSFNRNDLNSRYDANQYTSNTKGSSVSLTQRFPDSPWSLSASTNIDQRSRDSTIAITLPNMSITMSRISPFKRKNAVGEERWYEKIQTSYRGEFRNSITTKEDQLLKSNLQKDWKHAMRHSVPISATYSIFDNFNITPSVSYNERWYTEQVHQRWNGSQHVNSDTTYSFNRVYDFSAQIGLQTMVYGFFKPLFDKKTTIRHVFTPSISLGFTPDFGSSRFGYYDSYDYYDTNGELKTHAYSLYKDAPFGTPGRGKQGSINFQFDNNIEMKRQMTDTVKKLSLVDNLGIGFSYNMMADSLKWSDISTNMRLKLSQHLIVNINATFDPYLYDFDRDKHGNVIRDQNGKARGLNKIDQLRISKTGSFGRLIRTGYSISPSINQDTFNKLFGRNEKQKPKTENLNLDSDDEDEDMLDDDTPAQKASLLEKKRSIGEYDEDGYLKNDIKWTLSGNYSFNYAYDMSKINEETKEYKYKLVHSFGFSGSIQPTKNWSFNFSSSYDFDSKKIAYLNCNLSRNLHCFNLTASFIPIGPYKSYFISLRASSAMLQDLKYERRGRPSSYDPQWD